MASRCRSCHLSVPRPDQRDLPNPEHLLPLARHVGTLIDAAAEFDSFDEAPTTAVEFVRWLEVDLRRLAARP